MIAGEEKNTIREYVLTNISRLLFLFVNGLFILKYVPRLQVSSIAVLLIYCLLVGGVWYVLSKDIAAKYNRLLKGSYIVLVLLVVAAILLLQVYIDPFSVQVDRWSAIHFFLQNLFNGEYPYAARTHMDGYGSPFPVWQLFHAPFYLLGDVGLALVFVFILLSIVLVYYFKSYSLAFKYLVLLCISPAFWYEASVRSDLMYNFILCLVVILIFHRKQISIQTRVVTSAIVCGLFMSTRFSVFIPLAIYLFPGFLQAGMKKKLFFLLLSVGVFILTFLPFVFWDYDSLFFFEYNPFVLQTRQGSPAETVLMLLLVVLFGMKWKDNLLACCSYIALTIIAFIGTNFLIRMIGQSFTISIFELPYDITYFTMALPFLLFVLAKGYTVSVLIKR